MTPSTGACHQRSERRRSGVNKIVVTLNHLTYPTHCNIVSRVEERLHFRQVVLRRCILQRYHCSGRIQSVSIYSSWEDCHKMIMEKITNAPEASSPRQHKCLATRWAASDFPLHGSPTKVTISGALSGHGVELIATIPSPFMETADQASAATTRNEKMDIDLFYVHKSCTK